MAKAKAKAKGLRISELAERTGVPVATVKFYLREGLLPRGRKRSANSALYGARHVRLLGLIELLKTRGGLSIAAVGETLAALREVSKEGAPPRPALAALLEAARGARDRELAAAPSPLDRLDLAWLIARGLEVPGAPPRALHAALAALRDSGAAAALALDLEDLEPLVAAARQAARALEALFDRVLGLDRPLRDRLEMALELAILGPPILDGLLDGWLVTGR